MDININALSEMIYLMHCTCVAKQTQNYNFLLQQQQFYVGLFERDIRVGYFNTPNDMMVLGNYPNMECQKCMKHK